jgi:hypothetical protein
MNNSDYQIVKFTNITDFDFLPEMGAMYDGRPFFVKKGESMLLPLTIGNHLAKHLTQQIFIQRCDVSEKDTTNGVGKPLWVDSEYQAIKEKMLTNAYEEVKESPKSATDVLMDKVRQLNQDTGEKFEAKTYADKAEVIAELNKRGIVFDSRASKINLEKLLV